MYYSPSCYIRFAKRASFVPLFSNNNATEPHLRVLGCGVRALRRCVRALLAPSSCLRAAFESSVLAYSSAVKSSPYPPVIPPFVIRDYR